MTNLAHMLADESVDLMTFYQAWKERVERNAVARMRFAGLRFVVYCRRTPGFNPRRTMGYAEVRV